METSSRAHTLDVPSAYRLEAHTGYWLRRVSNCVSGSFEQLLQQAGSSVTEWVALSLIHEAGRTTPGKLAEATGMTKGAISKVLDKIETKGYLRRIVDSQDSRVQQLSLTPRGRQLVPKLAALADHNDVAFFGCLRSKEHTELLRLLRKLTQIHHINLTAVD